jgi:hypothetical protein
MPPGAPQTLQAAALPAERDFANEELPAWTQEREVSSDDSTRFVLTSRQYSTRAEAEQEVLAVAADLFQKDFEQDHAMTGLDRWRISPDDVRRHAVVRSFDEVLETDFGSFTAPMHRLHVQVELSPAVQAHFYPEWRQHVVAHRLWILGGLVGLVTLILGTSSTYFRLDSLTNGLYRRRLKVAATSLIVAGGLFAVFLIRQGSPF